MLIAVKPVANPLAVRHDICENIVGWAFFEGWIRFIGVGKNGRCAIGRVLEGLRGRVESGEDNTITQSPPTWFPASPPTSSCRKNARCTNPS